MDRTINKSMVARQERNPVLLVHGYSDTTDVFRKLSSYLTNLGWSIHSFNLIPNRGELSLDQLAAQVANYVDRNFDSNQPLDLIGFSMGGIVSRYYIQRLGGIERVQRFICMSAPNQGTLVAHPLFWLPGCQQMRRNSKFLQDLNRDLATLERLNFTFMWTPFDLMIIPANSSVLPIGKEVRLPVRLHSWMLTDQRSLKAIATALSEPYRTP